MTALLIALACLLLAAGVAGVLLPALPGLPLMFAGVWLLAYAQDYAVMGAGALVLTGALAAAGTLLDYVAGLLGARLSGASTRALWGAALGGVLGMALGLPGLALGPLLGAALGEYLARRQNRLRPGDFADRAGVSDQPVGLNMRFLPMAVPVIA